MLAERITRWFALSVSDGVPKRSATVALIVCPLLTAINQGDHVLAGEPLNWWKVALTFVVPYVVATVGAVGAKVGAMSVSAPEGERQKK
ncbi:MAG: nitrate/nitrite transporter NrtS [Pseudomonadota bacterium]